MANEPTQAHSFSSNNHQALSSNPLKDMVERLNKRFIARGSMHSHQSPTVGEQGSQSPTRAYQVSFIPRQRTNQTQL